MSLLNVAGTANSERVEKNVFELFGKGDVPERLTEKLTGVFNIYGWYIY